MKTDTKFDVIIVGGGPAGALLGYLLAARSVKTLILEKARLPRYKACGGGLTQKTLNSLPIDVSEIIECYVYNPTISVGNKTIFTGESSQAVMAMVMRDKFDHFLVSKAVNEGAVLHEETRFRSLAGWPGDLSVETSRGVYKARLIVGADGANSGVSRSIGLFSKRDVVQAIEGEVYLKKPESMERFNETAGFDFGVVPQGYGWIFPKKDHLSIGLLSVSMKTTNLRRYFKAYLELKGVEDTEKIEPLSSHLIPCRLEKNSVYADSRGLLIGDAAGVTDPVTGEGIYHAVREAQLALGPILKALESSYDHLTSYNNVVNEELIRDMICAKRMAFFLYGFPRFSYRVLRSHGEKLGKWHMDIISGKKSYKDLQQKLFTWAAFRSLIANPFD